MIYIEYEIKKRMKLPQYNPENRNWVVRYQISDQWEEKTFNSESQAMNHYYNIRKIIEYHAKERQIEYSKKSPSKAMEIALYDIKKPQKDILSNMWIVQYPENGKVKTKKFIKQNDAIRFYWLVFDKQVQEYRYIRLAQLEQNKKESR